MPMACHDTNDARVVSLTQTCLSAHLVDLGAVSTRIPRSNAQAAAHVAFPQAYV